MGEDRQGGSSAKRGGCHHRQPLSPLNALVTGASGFVGRHLVNHLLQQGDRVCGADRSHSPVGVECASWHSVDLLDRFAVRDLLADARPEVMYHLAGQASVAYSRQDPAGTFNINVMPLIHLITVSRELGLDPVIVVIGSNEVYGDAPLPTNEDAPLRPQSPYAASKAAQDIVALQYFLSDKVKTVRARPFTHIGPGQRPDFALSSFARQIAAIEAGVQPPVLHVGNLDAERDLTDARDMVRAYRLAGTRGTPGSVYNLELEHATSP